MTGMSGRAVLSITAAVVATAVVVAADLPTATPESVGMSSSRLARIDTAMEGDIAAGRLPGIVVGVARRGKVVYLKAFGVANRETREPMAPFNSASPEMQALGKFFRQEGLYTLVRWNTFFTNPPLCITEEQLREAFAIIDKGLEITDQAVK